MFTKLLAAAAVFASASVAQAVTFTSFGGAPDPGYAGQTLIDDFNSTTPPSGVTLTGGFAYHTGTAPNNSAAPAGDMTQYLYVSSALTPNNATLLFGQDYKKVSFYWGSIDKYNSVEVLGAGGITLLTMNGSQLPPADGDQGKSITNRRVTYLAGNGEAITGLRFISNGIAFELDDVAGVAGTGSGSGGGTVPEPASWAMMVAGFGLVGFATRRRRGLTRVAA